MELRPDYSQLQMVSQDDDNAFMIQIISMIAADTPITIQKINENLEKKDYLEISKIIHKYKSSVGILGMENLRAAITHAEREAKHVENEREFIARINKLTEIFGKLELELQAKLKSLGA